MIQIIKDDILSNLNVGQKTIIGKKTIILHGCNCFHTMGSGIAKYLRDKFPVIYVVDKSTTIKGDKSKMGTFSTANINGNLAILNCYTQYNYGREKKLYANYIAIEECFKEAARKYDTTWEIRMPKIGCGLANGDWNIVEGFVQKHLGKHDVKVYFK